jgi:hypothetical protein
MHPAVHNAASSDAFYAPRVRPATTVGVCVRACCAFAVIVIAGCGKSDLHRVSGRVHFPDGAPLTKGRVVVEQSGRPGQAWGRIRADGSFTIGTKTEKDGMLAGGCRVAIKDTEVAPENPSDRIVKLVDSRFESPATSGLSFEVPKQVTWDIEVEKP